MLETGIPGPFPEVERLLVCVTDVFLTLFLL